MSNGRRLTGLLVVLATLLAAAAPAAAQTPVATTLPPTAVASDAATLQGLFDAGPAPPLAGFAYAFQWGLTDAYGATVAAEPGVALGTLVPVAAGLTGLAPDTTYHYRLLVTDTVSGASYAGADEVFTTVAVPPPEAVTGTATSVTSSGATLSGTVGPEGVPTTYHFEVRIAGAATAVRVPATDRDAPGTAVSEDATGLEPATDHEFRLVATNAAGTAAGEWVPFRTAAAAPAAVALGPRRVTRTSATLRGTVNPHGAPTTVRFELAGREPTPDVDVGSGSSPVPVSVDVAGLSPQTAYTYTVVAVNALGDVRSAPVRFTTAVVPLPAAATGSATSVTATGATLTGTVGPLEVPTEYRFEVRRPGTTPVTAFPRPDAPATTDTVSAQATGLEPGTPYEFRVVGTNQSGSTAGAWVPFTTRPVAPTATTGAARDVTTTTAILQATVNPHGAATAVRFELDGRPATADVSAGAGTAPVAIAQPVGALAPGTTYRFRVVATNAQGTARGAFVIFTTTALVPASGPFTVLTGAPARLTATTARVTGTIAARPFAVRYAFAYGVTAAYGRRTAVREVQGAASALAVSETLTDLVPGTTYHVQLVAADAAGGQQFGGDRTFVAGSVPPAPRRSPATVSVAIAPMRDRRPPYRYRVTGRVALPRALAGTPGACGGRVRVTVRQGRRTRGLARSVVRPSCRYAVTVRAGGVVGRRGRLRLALRFLGSARLRAWSARTRTVRFG